MSLAYAAGRDRLLKVVGALRPSSLKANAVNDRHSGPLLPYTDTETGSWTRRALVAAVDAVQVQPASSP